MFNVLFVVTLYYNIINTWTLYYLGSSFISPLPWTGCDNDWNTPRCFHRSSIMTQRINNDTGYDLFNASSTILRDQNTTVSSVIKASSNSTTSQEEFWLYVSKYFNKNLECTFACSYEQALAHEHSEDIRITNDKTKISVINVLDSLLLKKDVKMYLSTFFSPKNTDKNCNTSTRLSVWDSFPL